MIASCGKSFKATWTGIVLLAVFSATPVLASCTATVTDNSDSVSDTGSLRYAIANASAGATICFSLPNPATITLTPANGPLTIGTSLTINGPGATSLFINGNHSVEVLVISGGITVAISGVTIENGSAVVPAGSPSGGGGIYNAGTLTVTNTTFSGNSVAGANGYSYGGGIYNAGTLTVTNSTFSGNSGSNNPNNFYGGGGIFSQGPLTVADSTFSGNNASQGAGIRSIVSATVNNSTFSGNTALYNGGGIHNEYAGTLTVTNSTFSGNSGPSGGGGIWNGYEPTLAVSSSIFAGSTGGNCLVTNAGIVDGGYNISDDGSCPFSGTSVNNTNPLLATAGLQKNGGPTQTIALQSSSPAINLIPQGNANCPGLDQRGFGRPAPGYTRCDAGAYEYGALPPCTGPVITAVSASPNSLWPPNHELVPVTVSVSYTGGCGSVSRKIISVSSNEPIDVGGDWVITGNLTLELVAARNGLGNGRVYTITVQAEDASGNIDTKTVTVTVPHDQGN